MEHNTDSYIMVYPYPPPPPPPPQHTHTHPTHSPHNPLRHPLSLSSSSSCYIDHSTFLHNKRQQSECEFMAVLPLNKTRRKIPHAAANLHVHPLLWLTKLITFFFVLLQFVPAIYITFFLLVITTTIITTLWHT